MLKRSVSLSLITIQLISIWTELAHSNLMGKGYWKYKVSLNKDDDFCSELQDQYRMWKSLKPGFESVTYMNYCIPGPEETGT